MQMLAKPSSNFSQRTGGDRRGGRAQLERFMMTCFCAKSVQATIGLDVIVCLFVGLISIIVKKLNSLKHLVRTTAAESHN